MVEVEPNLLPARALFDTGVVIRALGERKDSPAEICRKLWDAMIESQNTILVAAPTIAEILRFAEGAKDVPYNKYVEIVPFDADAARVIGTKMPMNVLNRIKEQSGVALTYLKYDALILACAARHRADCIVALDSENRFRRLASDAGVLVRSPSDFEARQRILLEMPPPGTKNSNS